MENTTNSWGRSYVDKYISRWDNNGTVGYRVFIRRHDLNISERFESLEKAIAFRDEALRLCELKRIQNVWKTLDLKLFPYNLIEALGFNVEDVIEHFESRLSHLNHAGYIRDREYEILLQIYREHKIFDQIAAQLGLSRARVQQLAERAIYIIRKHSKFFLEGQYSRFESLAKLDYAQYLEQKKSQWDYDSACEFIENYKNSTWNDDDIAVLDLSVRSYNCLRRAGIQYVSELIELNEDQLLSIRCLGKKSAREIIKSLERLGLSLSI